MKYLIILLIISFSNIVFADFRFTYNNHTYDVITTPQTWEAASTEAKLKSIKDNTGYLVHINDELENQKIAVELSINIPQKLLDLTNTFDAGLPNIPALWIGATDIDSEGSWKWVDDNTQFWEGDTNGNSVNSEYNNWGDVDGGAPFNYTGDELNGQDAGAFRLTNWIFGKKNQWDDVSVNNLLFYIVEYDAVENQENFPFFENGILKFSSVFVADASGCFENYSAELGLSSDADTISFSLINAKLLSIAPICDLNVNTQASYQNGDLNLPRVDVSDGLGSFVPYEAELALTPFSNPLSFKLLNAQKLLVLPSEKKEIFSDFIIISDCNPAEVLPCTVTVEDKSTGTVSIDSFGWTFSDAPNVIGGRESFKHKFNTPGVYQITHSIENFDEGLSSEISKEIVISIVSPSDPIPLLDDHPEQSLTPTPGFSLTGLSSAIWDHNNISVCWRSIPAAESTFRIWVQNAVEASWEKHSALDFTGWGLCDNSARPADIIIRVHDISGDGPGVNGGLGQLMTDMDLNFTFQNWNNNSSCNPTRTGAATAASIAIQKLCIESIAVHEFGHAIGIAHEQNRDDTPSSCTDPAQGTVGNIDVGEWDIDSVMNYCNPDYNNFGILSDGDIAGIKKFYPLIDLPTVEIRKVPKLCIPGFFGGGDGFFYTCDKRNNNLFFLERYRSTSSGEVVISSKQVKIVSGDNQCSTQYWYKSTDLPKLLTKDDSAYYEINECKDNISHTYIKYQKVGPDKLRTIRTESKYVDLPIRPFVRFDKEVRNKNGEKETLEIAYNDQYYGVGLDNTVERPSWVVIFKDLLNSDFIRQDFLYPVSQDTTEINSLFPETTTVGYSYHCSFAGRLVQYNDAVFFDSLFEYERCVDNVKEKFFSVYEPIPSKLPVW